MKAYQIMMFLMLFNLSISLLSIVPVEDSDGNSHYGLFKYHVGVPSKYNVSDYDTPDNPGEAEIPIYRFLGMTLVGLVTGFVAGTVVAYLTKVPADAGMAYGAFTGTFWGMAFSSMAVLTELAFLAASGNQAAFMIAMVFVFIFGGITLVVFAAGLLQMVRGGWTSFK